MPIFVFLLFVGDLLECVLFTILFWGGVPGGDAGARRQALHAIVVTEAASALFTINATVQSKTLATKI